MYQPGTSTDFTGTAYNAKSGGGSLANGFVTNNQGEAEAWFDTPQSIDVFVTDNSGAAYYPGSPTTPRPFSSFTESNWDLEPAREDHPTAAGLAADEVAAIINPFTAQTAVAGSTGKYADAAHAHPYTALTPAAPTAQLTTAAAGSLTNPARSDHAHPTYPGSTRPSLTSQTNINNSNTETVIAALTIPANTMVAGSTFNIYVPFWTQNDATGHTWTFRLRWGGVGGVQIGASATGTHVASAQGSDQFGWLEGVVTIRSIGGTGTAVGDLRWLERLTTAATNTLGGGAATAAATIDTTVNKDLVLTWQWGTAIAADIFRADQIFIQQVV